MRQHAPPQPRPRRHLQIGDRRCCVLRNIGKGPGESLLSSHACVGDRHRRHQRQHRHGRAEQAGHEETPPGAPSPQPMQADHGERQGREEEEVTVGQCLQGEGGDQQDEGTCRPRAEVAMQAQQGQRHPARHQDLEMVIVAQTVRRTRRGDTCEQRGIGPRGQLPREQECGRCEERRRRDHRDVVDEHRVARQPLQRRREQGHADQMIRIEQRVAIWVKKLGASQMPLRPWRRRSASHASVHVVSNRIAERMRDGGRGQVCAAEATRRTLQARRRR